MVEGVLQVHGQEAALSAVVVCLEPSSDGVDDGFTTVFGSEPQMCRAEVSCDVFVHGSQQGLRCKTPKSFSHGHRPVAAVLLFPGSERGTGHPGDSGAGNGAFGDDADHGVEGSHQLVSVPREKAPFGVLRAKARQSSFRIRREGKVGFFGGAVTREMGATGRSFLLAMSGAPCGGRRSRISLETFSAKGAGGSSSRAEQGGPGELAFLRQGRGPVVSSLKVARIVVRVCGVVVGFTFPFQESSGFLPWGSLGALDPLLLWLLRIHDGQLSGGARGRSRPGCQ